MSKLELMVNKVIKAACTVQIRASFDLVIDFARFGGNTEVNCHQSCDNATICITERQVIDTNV